VDHIFYPILYAFPGMVEQEHSLSKDVQFLKLEMLKNAIADK